jgi:hypothetical protein
MRLLNGNIDVSSSLTVVSQERGEGGRWNLGGMLVGVFAFVVQQLQPVTRVIVIYPLKLA